MLTFLAGMACGVLLMMAAIAFITRSTDNEPQPSFLGECGCETCRYVKAQRKQPE